MLKFTCYPNGLDPCPRRFTKITKVPRSDLRIRGIPNSAFIDDIFTKGKSYSECQQNAQNIVTTFDQLGYVIHPIKSQLTPKREDVSLGFIINSKPMTVNLTPKKRTHLRQFIIDLLRIKNPSIRFLAKVIGTLISTFPASKLGPLYYRNVEKDKENALNRIFGDYDSTELISSESKLELEWWLNNIDDMSNWIETHSITSEIYCDTSNIFGGTVFYVSSTGGAWNECEFNLHINTKSKH